MIKEEEGEGSDLSEDEVDRKLDSPLSNAGSERPSLIGEGDENEETFMSLDDAL